MKFNSHPGPQTANLDTGSCGTECAEYLLVKITPATKTCRSVLPGHALSKPDLCHQFHFPQVAKM